MVIDGLSVLSGGLKGVDCACSQCQSLNVECALSCYRKHAFRFEMTAAGTVDEMLAVKCQRDAILQD
jgi:hypothetical protein